MAAVVFTHESLCSQMPLAWATPSGYDPEHGERRSVPRNQTQKRKRGNRILIVGRLLELAMYRAEVLERAGFRVSMATDANDALRLLRRGEFDAIVLSYTLATETVESLAEAARAYCPDCPVIAITDSHIPDRRVSPDAVALANEGPAGLVAAVSRVLKAS